MNLRDILKQLSAERDRIESAIRAFEGIASASASPPKREGKRTISAAGRKRIAAAQRARWAKLRKAK